MFYIVFLLTNFLALGMGVWFAIRHEELLRGEFSTQITSRKPHSVAQMTESQAVENDLQQPGEGFSNQGEALSEQISAAPDDSQFPETTVDSPAVEKIENTDNAETTDVEDTAVEAVGEMKSLENLAEEILAQETRPPKAKPEETSTQEVQIQEMPQQETAESQEQPPVMQSQSEPEPELQAPQRSEPVATTEKGTDSPQMPLLPSGEMIEQVIGMTEDADTDLKEIAAQLQEIHDMAATVDNRYYVHEDAEAFITPDEEKYATTAICRPTVGGKK